MAQFSHPQLEIVAIVQYPGRHGDTTGIGAAAIAPGDLMQAVLAIAVGLTGGALGGLVGLGGGFIMVPLFTYLFAMPQHEAQGTSLAVLLPPVGILAVLEYWRAGHVQVAVALWATLGFLIGGYAGGALAQAIAGRTLRRMFAAFLVLMAIDLFRR